MFLIRELESEEDINQMTIFGSQSYILALGQWTFSLYHSKKVKGKGYLSVAKMT